MTDFLLFVASALKRDWVYVCSVPWEHPPFLQSEMKAWKTLLELDKYILYGGELNKLQAMKIFIYFNSWK